MTEDDRGGAGDRGPSGGRAPSRSSRPTTSSGGVMRPGTGRQEPASRTRWQQQQLQPPAFNTRSRNDTWQTGARAVQVAPVPAEKSVSDAPACAPGTEAARQAPGRWLWVSDDDSPAVDGGAAESTSRGAVRAPKAEAKPSLEGAAGTSRPPVLGALEGMQSQACARTRLMWSPTSLIVRRASWLLGVKIRSLTWRARYLTVKRESRVSVRRPYAHCTSGFRGSTWFNPMTMSSIRWCLEMGGLCRLNGRRAH